jgi:hypothetical protein
MAYQKKWRQLWHHPFHAFIPCIKHQPNHGIRSHLPTPILTDPTIAIYSFHHELLAPISLDLLLSHVEGVDCLRCLFVQSVGWSGRWCGCKPWPSPSSQADRGLSATRSNPPHLAWNDDHNRRKDGFDDDIEGGERNIIGSFSWGGSMVVFQVHKHRMDKDGGSAVNPAAL